MMSMIFKFLQRLFGDAQAVESHAIPSEFEVCASRFETLTPKWISAPSPKMFALVIGINKYHSVSDLEGAVPDAKAVVEYLHDCLRVPGDHIATLYDHEATRNNIIQALADLAKDTRIAKQDPLFIYYAGHGAELEAPPDWPTGGRMINRWFQLMRERQTPREKPSLVFLTGHGAHC
ncbi:ICE-like protease (caspase) p20 domain protein [Ceratobasidium sp. AG-Ba]|nr:ICE-like protease (caspase) p20 domain protein [Ceratobasidium sp. AG-Ba]